MDSALSVEVTTASGRSYSWHHNSPTAADRPAVSPRFESQRGTGFAAGGVTLRRRIDRDFPDLTLGDTVRFIGADGSIAYEGFITALPRTTEGGNAISVELAGFMGVAQDEPFREIYRDPSLSRWTAASAKWKLNNLANSYAPLDGTTEPDTTTGAPTLTLQVRGAWAAVGMPAATMMLDGGWPGAIGRVYLTWTGFGSGVSSAAPWAHRIYASDKDDVTSTDTAASNTGAGATIPGTINQTLTTPRRFLISEFRYDAGPAGNANEPYGAKITNLAIYGSHGLTVRGTEPAAGFYVSDLIRNMAARWAPLLDTSGVEDTSYIVRQAAYYEPVTCFDAWQDLNRYHLWDLAVWEDRRLVYAPPSSLDDWDWEIRASDPGTSVSLEGDQLPYNGVSVTFTDLLSGAVRTITPDDYADLFDASEANPATSHGRRRFFPTTVPFPCQEADAVQVGRARFAEAIRAQARGSIRTGPTIRDRAGNEHPAWKVRAGERVVIADLPNDRPRRITSASWDGRSASLATDNISRRMEAIFDARVPAARSLAGLG